MPQAASAYKQAQERTEGWQLLQLSEQCAAEGVMCDLPSSARYRPAIGTGVPQEIVGCRKQSNESSGDLL